VHAIQGAQQASMCRSPEGPISASHPFIGNPHVDVEQYLLWAVEKFKLGNGHPHRQWGGRFAASRVVVKLVTIFTENSGFADACI